MKYVAPISIELTASESELYKQIIKPLSPQDWPETEVALASLTNALLDRDAVPEIRVRLFADSSFAEVSGRSPREVFEANGTRGNDIFRHIDFVPYLLHFIHGPDLPRPVIEGLLTILNADVGTSGMVLKQYRGFARNAVRTYRLSPSVAATEFFRLGIEVGMSLEAARELREAARSTR